MPVQVLSRSSTSAVVEIPVTDSPRLLILEDSGEAPPVEELPVVEPPVSESPITEPPVQPPATPMGLEVTSVRLLGRRVLISGNAMRPAGVRLTASVGAGARRYVLRGRVQVSGGPFEAALKLPRSARKHRRIRRVDVVARIPGLADQSRWQL